MDPSEAVLERLWGEDAAQRAAGLSPRERTRNVDRETGRFLTLLARSLGAMRVLEIGSSNGLSTICLARGVATHGGSVIGTELIPERAAAANANIAAAGLAAVALVEPGDAHATIARLTGPFDLVVLDAEKDDYPAHLAAVAPLMRPGGVILADNVISHDLGAYQAAIRARGDLESVTLPLDRGLEYAVKIVPANRGGRTLS